MKASIGRIVHFYKPSKKDPAFSEGPFAAIVTYVHDEDGQFVNLAYLPHFPDSLGFQDLVWHKDSKNSVLNFYWDWPTKVGG